MLQTTFKGIRKQEVKLKNSRKPPDKSVIWNIVLVIVATQLIKGMETSGINDNARTKPTFRNNFKPVKTVGQPLFTTTSYPNSASIGNTNFSITMETNKDNPYIRTSSTMKTPSYKKFVTVVDHKMMSIDQHNSKKFLQAHKVQMGYEKQMGFKSTTSAKENETQWEYLVQKHKIDYQECSLVCSMMQATLPTTENQIKQASLLFNIDDEMWIDTNQTATKRYYWTWKHLYDYEVIWDNKTIYPQNEEDDSAETHIKCQAYRKRQPIQPDKIGYLYAYYTSENEFHQYAPRRLQTAINKNGTCKVVVAEEQHSMLHTLDNHKCLCVRKKSEKHIVHNQLEADKIHQKLDNLIEDQIIENWRYKTVTHNTYLEEVNNTMEPRYVNINEAKLKQMKQQYLIASDLTNLAIAEIQPKDLKMKDFRNTLFQGMLKTMLSNPAMIKELHNKAEKLIAKEPNTELVQTSEMMDNSENFADIMNERFPQFYFSTDKNKINVVPANMEQLNWEQMSDNFTDETAITGLRFATHTVLNTEYFKTQVLPHLIKKTYIPSLQEQEVDISKNTIIQIKFHPSYLVVQTYIPIYLQKPTTVYNLISLPHRYNQKTGRYVSKNIPSQMLSEPQADTSSNLTSKCQLEIFRNDGTLNDCNNQEEQFQDINEMVSFNDYAFYLITDVRETSITCPGRTMIWFDFDKQVNIIMKHKSCFLQTSNYNLQIVPTITRIPRKDEDTVLYLLAYNFPQEWVPNHMTRFIFQVVLAVIVGMLAFVMVIGILILIRKKPWVCNLPQLVVKNKRQAITFEMEKNEKRSTPDIEHNILDQQAEEITEYENDYNDYATQDDDKQTKIESKYATINRKREKGCKRTLAHPLIPERMSANVHWRFDGDPLNAVEKGISEKVDK